jgi:hypothetical protein
VVSLIAVRPGPFWEFYFDGPSGPGKHVLAEAELAGIEVIEAPSELTCGLSGWMHNVWSQSGHRLLAIILVNWADTLVGGSRGQLLRWLECAA